MKSQISNLKSQMGFTLIEVAIAMTLLALIAVVLYGSFYLGHRAVERAQNLSEETQRFRSSGELLASYIRSAYPCRASPRDASVFFSGEEDRLTFISALSSGMGGRGMSKVTVSWSETSEGSGSLQLEEIIPLSTGCQESGEGYRNSLVLDQGIREFRIDYLDPQSAEERWSETWDGKEKRVLPRAVRFNLRGAKGEEIQRIFPIMMSVLAP